MDEIRADGRDPSFQFHAWYSGNKEMSKPFADCYVFNLLTEPAIFGLVALCAACFLKFFLFFIYVLLHCNSYAQLWLDFLMHISF